MHFDHISHTAAVTFTIMLVAEASTTTITSKNRLSLIFHHSVRYDLDDYFCNTECTVFVH